MSAALPRHFYSVAEISAAEADMVTALREQMAIDPLSACKRRLMEEPLKHFVRWQMGEFNRETPVDDVYVAAVALAAWMVANAARNFLDGPAPARLAQVIKHVYGEASGLMQIGLPVDMAAPGAGREGLIVGGVGVQPDPAAAALVAAGAQAREHFTDDELEEAGTAMEGLGRRMAAEADSLELVEVTGGVPCDECGGIGTVPVFAPPNTWIVGQEFPNRDSCPKCHGRRFLSTTEGA